MSLDLLRETFETYADRAPSAEGLRERVLARRRVRRRGAWTVASAVAAVAAVLAGVTVVARLTERRPPVAAASDRYVWWHGVGIAIPASRRDCDRGAPKPGCGGGPGTTYGWWNSEAEVKRFLPGPYDWTDGTVDGVAVRRLVGQSPKGGYYAVLLVPSHRFAFQLMTDSAEVAESVLASARIADVDPYGCVAHPASTYATAPPERAEAATTMVPGGFAGASLCLYRGGWTVSSRYLDAAEAARLADVLDGLTPGFTEPLPTFKDDNSHAVAVTFRYPSGPPVTVWLHVLGRRELGASNGAVTGGLSVVLNETMQSLTTWRLP